MPEAKKRKDVCWTYGESLHVLRNVATEDVLPQGLSIEALALRVVSGETVLGVRDVETTVRSTFHGTEDTGTSGGLVETNIQMALEWAAGFIIIAFGSLGKLVLSISLLNTSESFIKAKLGQSSASEEKTSGIGGSPVCQTMLDPVALELMGVGGSENLVTSNLRGDDLADDLGNMLDLSILEVLVGDTYITVGEANNEPVLWSTVLGLVLGNQSLTGIVVGLS